MKRTPLKRGTKNLKRTGFKSLTRSSTINSKPFKSPEAIQTRKRTKAAAKRRRNGQWSTTTADNYFSKWIRERDGKCLLPYNRRTNLFSLSQTSNFDYKILSNKLHYSLWNMPRRMGRTERRLY